jgi:TRAP transporter TAXI family solute receptor
LLAVHGTVASPQSRRGFLLAAGLVLAGCSWGRPDLRQRLVLATGPAGGPYARFGRLLSREVRARSDALALEAVTSAASVENLRAVAAGRADLGLSLADMAVAAVAGRAPFHRPLRLSALARVYLNFTHLVVLAGSDVHRLPDLAGRRVAVGAVGSGTEVIAHSLLRLGGLTGRRRPRTLSLQLHASVEALRTGKVDALFWSGGVPTDALAGLAAEQPLRLLPLDDYIDDLRRASGYAYTAVAVPTGAYGLDVEVGTIGVANYLLARADLPADAAREVTETLFEAADTLARAVGTGPRLEPRFAISTGSVPLHPGAISYYRAVYG